MGLVELRIAMLLRWWRQHRVQKGPMCAGAQHLRSDLQITQDLVQCLGKSAASNSVTFTEEQKARNVPNAVRNARSMKSIILPPNA
jgi:hypothetical protein